MAVPFDQRPDLIWMDGKLLPTSETKGQRPDPRACITPAACSRASGPMAARSTRGTEHSERLKRSANILDFEIPYSVGRDRRRQAAGARPQQPERGLRARHRLARLGAVGRVGPAEQDFPPGGRDLGMAEAISTRPQRLKGIRPRLGRVRRPDPATAPCLAKAAGLYMICTISKHRAERKGYCRRD